MRIEALRLERYGVFESRTVDLSGPGLIVVHGPNEAGKSTCLNAISDFLFGIPHNSSLGVFGYDAMRIGATLQTAAGETLAFQRRKGRSKTLIDEAGVGHEDSALAGLLGATDRERFNQLFGLDHQSLRVGGERLLAADGEIGRLIVEAGGGLRHLMAQLEELDAEADKLFDTRRRADRAFYQGLDAFTDADGRLRATSLSREAYEGERKAREQALEHLARLRAEQQDGVGQASRLERLIRVAPLLGQLAAVEAELSDFEDLASLEAGFHDRWAAARQAFAAAEATAGEAQAAMDQLSGRLDKLVLDPRVTAMAPDLEDLAHRVVLIGQQRRDRPNRRRELADEEAKLAQLMRRLEAPDTEALAARLPPEEAFEAVQRLALAATGREARRQEATQHLEAARDAVATLGDAIASAISAGHGQSWGIEPSAFASLAGQVSAVEVRARQIEATRAALARDQAALGFSDLAALPCPEPGAIQAELAAREQLEAERMRQVAALATARGARDAAQAEIKRLREGGTVATDEALHAARAARGLAWTPIRDAYLGRIDRPDAVRAEDVENLEGQLVEADDIADRRATEAQRIAGLAAAAQRHAEASAAAQAAETAQQTLADALESRRTAFAAAFADVTARHPELPGLATFVAARASLLARADALSEDAAGLQRQQAELQPSLDLLALAETKAGLVAAPGAALAARTQAASAAIAQQDRKVLDLARRQEDLERAEATLRAQTRALEALDLEAADWRKAWRDSLAKLGASDDTAPEAAAALASQWASARGVFGSIAQTRRRIVRMDEDEAELRAIVDRLAAVLELEVPSDALEAAELLIGHGRSQARAQSDRDALAPELTQSQARMETSGRALEWARDELMTVTREAGLGEADTEAIEATANRTRERDDLSGRRARLLEQLAAAADGRDPVELRAQQGPRDVDALKGELAALTSRLDEAAAERDAAIQAAESARLRLEAFEQQDGANRALADRESATAHMHAALERYVEVRLAREVVAAAIARVRAAQQDPLVRRAGELFAAMTGGRFSGVETDVDDKGAPVVVGRRTGGATVPVSALSDGSRDQLFLAFRLASLEVYCRATEPLPFVADDILVHFDDPRSAATLELLADFARTTQVLLFTHHDSVRDAAVGLGVGRSTVVSLGA